MRSSTFLLIVVLLFIPKVGFAQTCSDVFKPSTLASSVLGLSENQELQNNVRSVLTQTNFPLLVKLVVEKTLNQTEEIKIVSISREQATTAGFPPEGSALFAEAIQSTPNSTPKPTRSHVAHDFNSKNALSNEALISLGYEPHRHLIILVKENNALGAAQQTFQVFHELSHYLFAKTFRDHPELIRKHFPFLRSHFNGRHQVFDETTINFLDELFANVIEYSTIPAANRVFQINWFKIGFDINSSPSKPVHFLAHWVRENYQFELTETNSLNLKGLEAFIEDVLHTSLNN